MGAFLSMSDSECFVSCACTTQLLRYQQERKSLGSTYVIRLNEVRVLGREISSSVQETC